MKRSGDLNNILDNLFHKNGILRCSYFSIFEPHMEDLIKEFRKCFLHYIGLGNPRFDIIFFFCCILSHLTNEYLHIDVAKAKQFFEELLLMIRNKIVHFEMSLDDFYFEDIVSQSGKYYVKLIELCKQDHETFINIIKYTESIYLPLFLKQHIFIKVFSNDSRNANMTDNLEIKNLKEAINGLEKHLENNSTNKIINFSVVTVNGASEISTARMSDQTWNRVVFGKENGMVFVADLSEKLNNLFGHSMMITGIHFTSQSDQILTSSLDGSIKVWNEETSECIQTYCGHYFPVWDVTSNPQIDACFASGSMDGCVCIWDAHRENPVRKMIGHLGSIKTVLFYKSGNYLASGGDDGQVRLWDTRMGNCVRLWEATDGSKGIEGLAFSENGNEIICGTDGGLVEWMGIEGGSCVSLHLEETISNLVCHQQDRVIASTINGGLYVLDQTGLVSRECDNQFSRIINIQGQPEHGSQALVLREYE